MYKLLIFFVFLPIHFLAQDSTEPYLLILGTAQDAGYPQLGCERDCCNDAWKHDSLQSPVVSLALVVPKDTAWYLFEATPDFHEQLHAFRELTDKQYDYLPSAIFLTHAHMGHYTGLMELGKEALNSKEVPVYTLPKFNQYLKTNGPWSQLVKLKNIVPNSMKSDSTQQFASVQITAFQVPHRDEYSETAGFKIKTEKKSYLFIPDIDKWGKWDRSIVEEVKKVDLAMVDATFYSQIELPFRNIKLVPHPFVSETVDIFKGEEMEVKNKLMFIHFNHTNPLLRDQNLIKEVEESGFKVARLHLRI